MFSPMQIINAN